MADRFDVVVEIRKAEEQILQLNTQLEEVSRQIEAAVVAISGLGGPGSGVEVQYWMKEKDRLGTKESQLRTEKDKLRTEKDKWLDILRGGFVALSGPPSILGKREYFNEEYPSASDFSEDTAPAIKWQGQSFDRDRPHHFIARTPLAANGRCMLGRCPLALVHEAFGACVDCLAGAPPVLTEEHWQLYKDCAQVLSFYHRKEETLQGMMAEVLDGALRSAGLPTIHKVANTDGALIGPKGVWVGVLECKRMQGDAELQLARYFQDYLRVPVENKAPVVCMSLMPCVTLEVVGNELRLGAFWYETVVCAARFMCVEYRLDSSLEEKRAGALLLYSWLALLKELHEFYEKLSWQGRCEVMRSGIPYALAYQNRFEDIEVLAKYRLYRATDRERSEKVVIKFVERYREEAHLAWSGAGLAVNVLELRQLPGGYVMLVMPYLDPEDGWLPCHHLDNSQEAKAIAMQLLQQAHAVRAADDRSFVHGDARASNIMVRLQEGRVANALLIDLDWSGVAGIDTYMYFPNPYLGPGKARPVAVKCGGVMQQEHDTQTLLASFGLETLVGGINR